MNNDLICVECKISETPEKFTDCETCFKQQICKSCIELCDFCSNFTCKDCLEECGSCDSIMCDDCLEDCGSCGRIMCYDCLEDCLEKKTMQ
ncbi:MAG: hypothetical protein AABY22_22010 [Nanoarchaeota archaeon]